jgi:hypothetical protein
VQRKFRKNALGLQDKLGRGVHLLEPNAEVIFSERIPPDR